MTSKIVVKNILDNTNVRILRQFASQHRSWSSVYPGRRPQLMKHQDFLLGLNAFALDGKLFENLCEAFLQGQGIPRKGSLQDRFLIASQAASLTAELRAISGAFAAGQSADALFDHPNSNLSFSHDLAVEPFEPVPEEEASILRESTSVAEPTEATSPGSMSTEAKPVEGDFSAWSGAPSQAEEDDDQVPAPRTPYSLPPKFLEWTPPSDDIDDVQRALTRFERAMVALIQHRLEELHKDAWLRRGCGKLLAKMKNESPPRVGRNGAKEPETILGLAHIRELGELMTLKENWPAFREYFNSDQNSVLRAFDTIATLRVEGAHAGQRQVYVTEELEALAAMIRLLKPFHPATADLIDGILQERLGAGFVEDEASTVQTVALRDQVMTNLGQDFDPPELLGREKELKELEEFWDDPTRRVISIVGSVGGGGGVGKTALLEAFIGNRLSKRLEPGAECSPNALVFLTAKDNYYPGIHTPAPESRRFSTQRRIFEIALEVAGEDPSEKSVQELRSDVFALTSGKPNEAVPMLFALDNLETLNEEELEEIGEFLSNLPNGCKAIITTRDDRRSGRRIALSGLSYPDSLALLKRSLEASGVELEIDSQDPDCKQLYELTAGVPLHIKFCANLLVDGLELRQAVESLKGAKGIELLEFSFDSSLKSLRNEALAMAYYLSLMRRPAKRSELLEVVHGNDELFTEVHNRLLQLSFVERTSEDKKQVRFQMSSPLLKEHTIKRAPEILSADEARRLRGLANATPDAAESARVSYEIERAIQGAIAASVGRNWQAGISFLEGARHTWGDDPRILAQLGYYYFRAQRRASALQFLQWAINLGHESSDTYAHLALALFYEGRYDDALKRADQASQLRETNELAHQIAGQALLSIVTTNRFTLDEGRRIELLQKAKQRLERSYRTDLSSFGGAAHNERTTDLLHNVEMELAKLGNSGN